ncbi:unnamed protein product [Blepharisma stoltei]|uniref:Uncharacterized protein n=1 Tax=Blepharisma stoltei TaxID=1481888 RepID=A0AAU9K3D0_9CILI|nr:unnamed protein product [Blepharisma stoltei]
MEALLKAIEEADKEIEMNKEFLPKKNVEIKKEQGVTTFGTSKRTIFENKKNDYDVMLDAARPGKRVTGGVIGKASKVIERNDQSPVVMLNPNYDYILKKAPSVTIKDKKSPLKLNTKTERKQNENQATSNKDNSDLLPSSPVPKKAKAINYNEQLKSATRLAYNKSNEENSLLSTSISTMATEFDDFMKMKAEWEEKIEDWRDTNPDFVEVNFKKPSHSHSLSTEATSVNSQKSFVGPGAYQVNYSYIERNHLGSSFGKSPKKPKEVINETELPIDPNYNAVKKSIPGFKIAQDTERNEKLKLKDELEDLREEKAAILWKLANPDKPHEVHGGIIAPESTAPHRPENTKVGPGRYSVSYDAIEPDIKGAVEYHQIETIPRPPAKTPGPTTYTIQDQVEPIGGYIPIAKREKSPEEDRRKALNVQYDLVEKRIPEPTINPEHKKPPLPPDAVLKLGPGKYDPQFTLIEQRADKGVLTFHPDNSQNKPPESDLRIPLYPDDTLLHPSHPTFQYHEPTVIEPPHPSNKLLFPERWKFYDFSDDNKFDKPQEADFSNGIAYEDFKMKEKEREIMMRINQKLKGILPNPAPGTYDYEPIQERAPAYDFGKAEPREPAQIDIDEPKEGDILLIDPIVKHKVPMLVNMDKAQGRDEKIDEYEEKTELLINPNKDYIKKKIPMFVNMAKDQGRVIKENELEEEKLDLNVKDDIIRRKVPMLVNIDKQVGRQQEEAFEEEMIATVPPVEINEDAIRPRRAMLVNMEKQTGREEITHNEEEVYVPPPITIQDPTKPRTLGVLGFDKITGRESYEEPRLLPEIATHPEAEMNLERARSAIEPEKKAPSFDRYTGRTVEITEDWDEIVRVNSRSRRVK